MIDHDSQGGDKPLAGADTGVAPHRAHEMRHDTWFRAQVMQAIKEADDPNTPWVSDEEATASWAEKRATLVARAMKDGAA